LPSEKSETKVPDRLIIQPEFRLEQFQLTGNPVRPGARPLGGKWQLSRYQTSLSAN
jgi:hypothetical protein